MASPIRLYQRPRWLVLLLSVVSFGSYIFFWSHFTIDEIRQNGHPRLPSPNWILSAGVALLGGFAMGVLPRIPGAMAVGTGFFVLAYSCLVVFWLLNARYFWKNVAQVRPWEGFVMGLVPLLIVAWYAVLMAFGDRLFETESTDPSEIVQRTLWVIVPMMAIPVVALCSWVAWVQGLFNRYWRSRIPAVPTA